MDKKATANARQQQSQQQAQQVAMNHQLHTHTISVLTELFKNTSSESKLYKILEETLISLVEPFGPPQPQSPIITTL